jgi:formylglycine-generating enzyme required for sulfatase activity
MAALPGFCMDRYEAPNIKGERPFTGKTAFEGEAWCETKGKRLCSEAEWVRACEGARKFDFPYGKTYKRGACNDDKRWISPSWSAIASYPAPKGVEEIARLNQSEPSGDRPGCESEDGVQDLTGNVAEWVTRSFPNANNYPHVMKGCFWAGCYGGSPPSCGFVNPAHPGGFRSYESGFRCCLTPAKADTLGE